MNKFKFIKLHLIFSSWYFSCNFFMHEINKYFKSDNKPQHHKLIFTLILFYSLKIGDITVTSKRCVTLTLQISIF